MMLLINLKSKCYELAYTNYIIDTFFYPMTNQPQQLCSLSLDIICEDCLHGALCCTSRYF